MLTENKAKARLKAGGPVVGCTTYFVHPTLVEFIGMAGFDFVLFDGEHGPVSPESLEIGVLAAENIGLTPLARVPVNRPEVILRFMDTGLAGVLVPHVDTADDAEAAVRSMKYHPRGERGLAGVRAAGYGRLPTAEYIARANAETMLLVMIESVAAVENIEAIAAVDGVDVLNIGTSDLSQSMGRPGAKDDPELIQMLERVLEVGRAAGKGVAVGGLPLANSDRWKQAGATWFSGGATEVFVSSGRRLCELVRGG